MGSLVLQLGNSSNWENVYSSFVQAVTSQDGTTYTPIPEITIPILLEQHIIAISITSATAKPSWHFGGFLNQKISLGILVGGLPDSDSVQKRRVYLNRITLLIFPKLAPTYSLSLEVPKWFQDVTFNVFQYVGTESDSTEDLINQIKNVDLPRIEGKIDALHH